ncbi:MAG: hypothetical protein JST25_03690 [Actinobacteria bacterium]|nr:hypothetical protein [Actinomycetota bacterium]
MTDPQQHTPASQPPTPPGYSAAGAATPGAPLAAGARPSGAGSTATLALVFACTAALVGWANSIGTFLTFRLGAVAWIFPVLGGFALVVLDLLALVFGILAARRGGGVKAGIAIGIATMSLLGLLFGMLLPLLYSALSLY